MPRPFHDERPLSMSALPRSYRGFAARHFSRALTRDRARRASPTMPIEDKAKLCATCHGEQGIPMQKTFPVIWGQNAGYLFLQLRDFKSGARKNDLMSPIAATLRQEDLLPLAEYFSKLKWPNLQQPPAPAGRRHQGAKPRPPRSAARAAISITSRATARPPGSPARTTTISSRP